MKTCLNLQLICLGKKNPRSQQCVHLKGMGKKSKKGGRKHEQRKST